MYGYSTSMFLINSFVYSSAPPVDTEFKITVDTTQAGSASDTFVLPLHSGTTSMTVYWGDGNSDVITAYNQAELTHVYASSGTYQISCDGSFAGIKFNNTGDKLKLSSIDNWGTNQFSNMQYSFYGCSNMVGTYSDNPDTSLVADMIGVFRNCTSFNSAIDFDGSSLLNASVMFLGATSMNSAIAITNTTLLENCTSMFSQMSVFNQPITLDTTSVINMSSMFSGSSVFDSTLTFSDTSNVLNFSSMFYFCFAYNKSVSFDTSSGTNMSKMFAYCYGFNQSVNFTTTNVLTMQEMFRNCTIFNQPLLFDTSSCSSFLVMFYLAPQFNQDLSTWNISSLTTATSMFLNSGFSTTNYDLLLPAWDAYGTSGVTFHAGTAQYNTGAPATARANMISRSWTITDGGAV